MIDLDALEQYAPGQIIPFPSDRLREIAAEVRNCREAWAQMARAKERESERIAVLEAALGGAISDLASHDCDNFAEFKAVLGEEHDHGWECFETSGGMTNAMEVATPLPERIETVYKTGYWTGFKNGQKRLAEVLSAARSVAERFTEGELLTAAAVYRLRQALTAFDDFKGK